jgi:hypothetical protein
MKNQEFIGSGVVGLSEHITQAHQEEAKASRSTSKVTQRRMKDEEWCIQKHIRGSRNGPCHKIVLRRNGRFRIEVSDDVKN